MGAYNPYLQKSEQLTNTVSSASVVFNVELTRDCTAPTHFDSLTITYPNWH